MIKAQKLQKSYGSLTVLSDVSFSLGRGQKAALVGHNGTGKTTLLKIVAGLENQDAGKIEIAGDVCIGYLPQDTSLSGNESVVDYLRQVSGIDVLEKEIESLSAELSDPQKARRYGEIVEDPLGRHKPGTTFVINHGDIGSTKFPKIMFPAVNPIEFYLFSALKNLENIRTIEPELAKDSGKINQLLLEEFQFCIFAVSAVEAFVNQTIPADFEYKDKKGTVTKIEIERLWTIEEKLKKVIPQAVNVSIAGDTKIWKVLTSLILLRNDLIHLKTAYPVVSDFRSYQDLYRRLLDHDYGESYKTVQEVIKRIAVGGDKIYGDQKAKADKETRHSSWIEILKRGLRSLTG